MWLGPSAVIFPLDSQCAADCKPVLFPGTAARHPGGGKRKQPEAGLITSLRSRQPTLQAMTTNADVVVVGAGAAGIAAARRLATSGLSAMGA